MQSITNKKKTIRKSLCGACLCADRKLTESLEFGEIFQLLCKNFVKKNSKTLLCFECLALLKNVKRFQEKVQKSQIILKNYTTDYFEQNLLNGLSNLSTTVANILELSKPLNNEQLCDDENIEIHVNLDTMQPKVENHNTYASNTFDNDPLEEETKICPQETVVREIQIKTEIDTENDYIQDFEEIPVLFNITKQEEIKIEQYEDSERNLQNYCQPPGRTVIKKKKSIKECNILLNRPRSELYKVIETNNSYAYKSIRIPYEEVKYWMDRERNSSSFKNALYKCEKCALTIEQKKLKEHSRRHSNPLRLICDYCTLSFANKLHLWRHMETHRYIRFCATCGYKGIGKDHMYKHIYKAHDGGRKRIVQCLSCETILKSIREFCKHYRNEHYQDNSKFICDYCNRKCGSRRTMEKHIFIHHTDYKCKICDITFKTRVNLKTHNKLKHTIERSKASYCEKCHKQFDNVMQLRNHVSNSIAHVHERKIPPTKKTFPCLDPSCPKVYTKRYNMMVHHSKSHTNENKYQCLECNKCFLTNCRLKEHNKYHHEGYEREKKYRCTTCGRGFVTSDILKRHIRTHTGERPYQCPHCDAKFGQRSAMVTHKRNIHKIKADMN